MLNCPDCIKEDATTEFIESEFYKTKTARGISTYCKKHTKVRAKRRREEKEVECKEYQKDYRGKNRKKLSSKHRDWVGKNREKVKKYNTNFKAQKREEEKKQESKK